MILITINKVSFCFSDQLILFLLCLILTMFCSENILAEVKKTENASNPLAAVNNTDLRVKYYDLDDSSERLDYYIDGAAMLNSKLKLKYELHYWDTDVTGEDEKDLESLHLKFIYFPMEGKLKGGQPYRLAAGAEWIKDLGDTDKGIGSGADQIAPLVGIAIGIRPGTMIVPLIQHYEGYNGDDVSQTALRLIALQTFPDKVWGKMDLKVPYDWENDEIPSSVEFQIGKSFTNSVGAYIDLQAGIGGDKSYDFATGFGLRFNY